MTNSSNRETGFASFVWPGDGAMNVSKTFVEEFPIFTPPPGYPGITVTLSSNGGMNYRSRTAPAMTGSFYYTRIINDRIAAGGTEGITLTIANLKPNTTYSLQIWGWDGNGSSDGGSKAGTNTLYNITNGRPTTQPGLDAVLFGKYTTTAGQLPVDNNSFSVTNSITTDANGTLKVLSYTPSGGIDGAGIFNAFVLSDIPEPSSAFLSVIGVSFVAMRRRRVA